MSRACTTCTHPARAEIDAALATGNGSIRGIAERYQLTATSLTRHRDAHLPAALVASEEAREAVQAADLFAQTEELHARAVGLLTKAEKAGDLRAAVAAVHAAKGCLELSAKMRSAVVLLERSATPHDPTDEEVEAATRVIDARIAILEVQHGR